MISGKFIHLSDQILLCYIRLLVSIFCDILIAALNEIVKLRGAESTDLKIDSAELYDVLELNGVIGSVSKEPFESLI